jgi:DNA-binding transcriptional regulator YdaS (Cro superfamily)
MCCSPKIKDQKFPDPTEKFPEKWNKKTAHIAQTDLFLEKIKPSYLERKIKEELPKTWRWRVKRIGWHENAFSRFLGLKKDSVSSYCRGVRAPSLERLARIEHALRLQEAEKGYLSPKEIMWFDSPKEMMWGDS